MADHRSFDADAYLETRFKDVSVNDRVRFLLNGFHEAFQSLPYSLKILEIGSGPVIQHCISAAAHASEIVLSDFAESNREAVRKWLKRDPTAFNWSPHFDYVVQTLEGKGEKEAREREEMLRKAVKDVVYCDVLAQPAIEKGFEGPYDVLIETQCLTAACSTLESFKEALVTLSRLLKPGGTFVMCDTDIIMMEQTTTVYRVGSRNHNCLCVEREFVLNALKEAGFTIMHVHSLEYDQSKTSKHVIHQPGLRRFYFIIATKGTS